MTIHETRENPAPLAVRIRIPPASELLEKYEEWKNAEEAGTGMGPIFPPDVDLDEDDFELFGELVAEMYEAAPSDVMALFTVAIMAKNTRQSGREMIAQIALLATGSPPAHAVHFFVTDSGHAMNTAAIELPSFKGQRGGKASAKDELAALGWTVVPDTRQTQYAPPERVLRALGLERLGAHGGFATPFQREGISWGAYMRGNARANPDDGSDGSDGSDGVAELREEAPGLRVGGRRVVNRPREAAASTVAAIERMEGNGDEDAPAASAASSYGPRRARPPRKHVGEPELAEIHAAAAGEQGARSRLAQRYHKFIHRMAFAFLKAWSPDAGARTLAKAVEDITSEVEQRVFVGTTRAKPAIEKLVVGGKRKRAGHSGFSAGSPATGTGEDRAAKFTTWLGAVVRNVARKYVRDEVRRSRPPATVRDTEQQADALDEVLDFEEREAHARKGREQSAQILQGLDALRDAGKTKELEVLSFRQRGKSYKEIAAELNITVAATMNRLYRARKALETLSGVELRGLVGQLAGGADEGGLGGAIPGKRGRPRGPRAAKENPEVRAVDGTWVYFEDVGDAFDLFDEGLLDEDGLLLAVDALAEFRADAFAL